MTIKYTASINNKYCNNFNTKSIINKTHKYMRAYVFAHMYGIYKL